MCFYRNRPLYFVIHERLFIEVFFKMKCPKCKYVSFEHLNRCRKCGIDLTPVKTKAKIDFPHSLHLGLLSRSEENIDIEEVEPLIGKGSELEDSEISNIGGADFDGVASTELGTDGYRSVEDNSAGEIILEQADEEPDAESAELVIEESVESESPTDESQPFEIPDESDESDESDEQDGIAFDLSSMDDLGEDTSGDRDATAEPDDPLTNLSLEVEDLEDTLEEEIVTAMSTPQEAFQEPMDDDETFSDVVISAEKLVDTETLIIEREKELSDLPTDTSGKDEPVESDVIELDISDDELEIVSKGTKNREEEPDEPKGLNLDDLDLSIGEDDLEEEGENIDDMEIDLDDTDLDNLNMDGK